MSVLLKAHHLHKRYTDGVTTLEVLKGVDLSVNRGEALAIVGPSGAGKSTLLHLLGGLDRPSDGEVRLDGVDLYRLNDTERARARNRQIGFVFQLYHLLPELTALENVLLPLWIAGAPTAVGVRERAEQCLRQVGLGERLRHRPGQLSGGEMQRVAIARALVHEPQLLLCDEPTGNLDSHTGAEVIRMLWELRREQGRTLVIVTHDERLAAQADRVLHIRDGHLVNNQ